MSSTLGPRTGTAVPLGFSVVLGRLMLGGLYGGLLAGAWLLLVTEPVMRSALMVEHARQTGGAPAPHAHLVGRTTQLFGGVLGTVLTGVLLAVVFAIVMGVLFAVAYTAIVGVLERRDVRPDPTGLALLLCAGMFVAIALVPGLKYPANPPGVGARGTVTNRTAIYGAVLLCGVVIALVTGALVWALRDRGVGSAPAAVAATFLAVTLTGVVMILMPESPDIVPPDMPMSLVVRFRLASLGQLLVLWAGMGLVGGWLLDRALRRKA